MNNTANTVIIIIINTLCTHRGNSVCILSISSERIGTFWLHLTALIKVSIEAFWHSYTWHLIYILFTSFLTLNEFETYIGGYFLKHEVDPWFYQFNHETFSKNVFCLLILHCTFAKFITSNCQLYEFLKCSHFC